jgi:hypothetical protein
MLSIPGLTIASGTEPMSIKRRLAQISALLCVLTLAECSQPAPANLAASLKGIEKSRFLSCSGPPLLATSNAGQDHMSFVTNLRRGETIGITSPTAFPVASCSVDAVFENDRLVSSTFSGDMSMCSLVFGPCVQAGR